MKSINLEKLESVINKFSEDRDWNQFHSIKNLSMALSVETSELLEIFQWMTEEDSNKVVHDTDKMQKVKAEVADILVYLIRISSKLNINLEEAVLEKMIVNEKKYPVDMVKGHSKKYDEY